MKKLLSVLLAAVMVLGVFAVGASAAFTTTPMVSAGLHHSLALKSDGTVWGWGWNNWLQLGDGTNTSRRSPVQVKGLSNIVAVSAGSFHSLALKADGTVWAWGYNDYGVIGDGTKTPRSTAVQVESLNDIIAIQAGYETSFALKNDGTIWVWGQTAGNVATIREMPVQFTNFSNVTTFSGDIHALALNSDGTILAWGDSRYGQLGSSTSVQLHPSPKDARPVDDLSDITAVAVGSRHSLALDSGGVVWAWGLNNCGQLGDNSLTNRWTSVQVQGLSGVTAIAGGGAHSLALKDDKTVWAWGLNDSGQLGDGSFENRSTAVQVQISDAIAIAAGGLMGYFNEFDSEGGHSLAIKSDGTVWAWGNNGFGQLGDNTTTYSNVPVQVRGLNVFSDSNPPDTFKLWGVQTRWEKNFWNWVLCIVCFGWIWMAF